MKKRAIANFVLEVVSVGMFILWIVLLHVHTVWQVFGLLVAVNVLLMTLAWAIMLLYKSMVDSGHVPVDEDLYEERPFLRVITANWTGYLLDAAIIGYAIVARWPWF